MDPVPKMVIATPLATRKGHVEVGSVEEIRELISALIIAEAGILGAASAIGAQGAMDAAREVEAERAQREDDVPPCPSYSLRGDDCVVTESHWLHKDRDGRTWLSPEGDPGGPEEPKAEATPEERLLLAVFGLDPDDARHVRELRGHRDECTEDDHTDCLAQLAAESAPELPAPEPVPLDQAVMRLVPMEGSALKAALVDISQAHPGVFNEVIPAAPPALCGTGACPGHGLPCTIPGAHDLPHKCARGCEFDAEPADVHLSDLVPLPLGGVFFGPLPPEPGENEGDPDVTWPREPRPAVSAASLAPKVRELSRPAVPAGRHASVTPLHGSAGAS